MQRFLRPPSWWRRAAPPPKNPTLLSALRPRSSALRAEVSSASVEKSWLRPCPAFFFIISLLCTECWRTVDLALVLDMSGSTEDHHQLALRLSRRLVDRMDVGRQTRVALLSFADHSTTHFNFNTYLTKSQVMSAINIVPSRGRTNTQARCSFNTFVIVVVVIIIIIIIVVVVIVQFVLQKTLATNKQEMTNTMRVLQQSYSLFSTGLRFLP